MKKVLITGVSSGLGAELAEVCWKRGDEVFTLGRSDNKRLANQPRYYFLPVDLSDVDFIAENIKSFIKNHTFDRVILNAGVLGEIKELSEFTLQEGREIMALNLWANKALIDALDLHSRPRQIVAVSSGAAVNGSKGWGPYSLSKAALNMLLKVYAAEKPWIHFSAIAPGVIMTPMLKRILETTDEEIYPSIRRIKEGPIQGPESAALRFLDACDRVLELPSGSFLDVRTI